MAVFIDTNAPGLTVKRSDFKRIVTPDTDPDFSDLGEYSNKATSPAAIDREARGDMGRHEFRYFNPAMTGEETGNPESPEQDYQRMEAYNRGEWYMVSIQASAVVSIPAGNGSSILQTVITPGLWGVESDSGYEYLEEVYADECDTLEHMLRALGVKIID